MKLIIQIRASTKPPLPIALAALPRRVVECDPVERIFATYRPMLFFSRLRGLAGPNTYWRSTTAPSTKAGIRLFVYVFSGKGSRHIHLVMFAACASLGFLHARLSGET